MQSLTRCARIATPLRSPPKLPRDAHDQLYYDEYGHPLETPPPIKPGWRPVRKVMAANRGEIALRVMNTAQRLGDAALQGGGALGGRR